MVLRRPGRHPPRSRRPQLRDPGVRRPHRPDSRGVPARLTFTDGTSAPAKPLASAPGVQQAAAFSRVRAQWHQPERAVRVRRLHRRGQELFHHPTLSVGSRAERVRGFLRSAGPQLQRNLQAVHPLGRQGRFHGYVRRQVLSCAQPQRAEQRGAGLRSLVNLSCSYVFPVPSRPSSDPDLA